MKPSKPFDTGLGAAGFGICPARFQSCDGPVLPTMSPFLIFGRVMCTLWLSLYVEMCNLSFDLTGGHI